jgi:hypothetical protein
MSSAPHLPALLFLCKDGPLSRPRSSTDRTSVSILTPQKVIFAQLQAERRQSETTVDVLTFVLTVSVSNYGFDLETSELSVLHSLLQR